MKLSKLFVIALLAGTLGVLGCGDDETGDGNTGGDGGTGGNGATGGSGGSGGSVADHCTGGLCNSDTQVKTNCQELIAACNDFEGGTGGTGGSQVPPTSEQCNAIGTAYCTSTGAGGSGGSGGSGGTGGTPDLGCNEGKCTVPANAQICEDFVLACFVACDESVECGEDECLGIGLLWCNIEE
jgi:hypothetical protein